MEYLISAMRYVSPVAAVVILLVCIVSLFRNRPRIHTLAKLIDQNDGSEIEINHWETSIGKSKANDVVLPFPTVYRFHAVIAKKRIMLNGRRVDGKAVIENGDIITIGNIPLKFECDDALSQKSRTQLRSQVQTAPNTVAYGVLVDVKTKRPVYLKKRDVLIGRGNDCDIQILDDTVSSNHARIYQTSRGWAVADLDSHNGTKLNGRYINQTQLIFDEDMLTFGDKVFVFYDK